MYRARIEMGSSRIKYSVDDGCRRWSVGYITTTQIILDNNRCTISLVLVIPVRQSTYSFLSDTRVLKTLPAADEHNWSELSCWQASSVYSSVDVLRRTQYRTPVGPLENAVLCCALFTKPYHSNDGVVLLRVCVPVGMSLHSKEHLQINTVTDRLSMFATCVRIPWKVLTGLLVKV
jgi:hypothetical protein